jgi:hypothetical protein
MDRPARANSRADYRLLVVTHAVTESLVEPRASKLPSWLSGTFCFFLQIYNRIASYAKSYRRTGITHLVGIDLWDSIFSKDIHPDIYHLVVPFKP